VGRTFLQDVPDDLVDVTFATSRAIFNRLDLPTKLVPSTGACLQASRRLGGASSLFPALVVPELVRPSGVDIYGPKVAVFRLQSILEDHRSMIFEKCMENVLEKALVGDPGTFPVVIAAIPEPGKWRIISKGDGFLYTALQPLQGQLLDAWKSSKFSTMRSVDLTERVQALDGETDFDLWCSGDFEAATDLLRKELTFAALSSLSGHRLFEIAMASFMPCPVRYPGGEEVLGGEGQLMGHPLSFPLLCVVNLAVYRCALKRYAAKHGKSHSWLRRHWSAVLINGDDVLFKCDRALYEIWRSTAADAGLKISVGKNYLSPDSCMINSQVFQRRAGKMVRKGYLNLKFITGYSLKEGQSNATPLGIARDLQAMIDLLPCARSIVPTVFARWPYRRAFKYFEPNWYVPQILGGYGLTGSYRVTREQRRVASLFALDPGMALIRMNPSRSFSKYLKFVEPKVEILPASSQNLLDPSMFPMDKHLRDWDDMFRLLDRYAHPGPVEANPWKFVPLRTKRRNGRSIFTVRPMPKESIELYRSCMVYASRLSSPPPLPVVRLPPLRF
jgi:hypothetical protein